MTGHPDAISAPRHSMRVGSSEALLAVIPHLLGFHPQSSLVVIGTEPPDGAVKLTLRYDLPDPADPGVAADIAEHAAAILAYHELNIVIAVGYGPGHLVTPVIESLREAAGPAGLTIPEALRADDGRYWSYACTSRDCCPPEGTRIDPATQSAPVPAADGATVLPGRAALAASIAPLADSAAESMHQATHRAEQHLTRELAKIRSSAGTGTARRPITAQGLAALADMITTYRAGGSYPDDDQVALLTVSLKDMRVRDDAWARMDPRHRGTHRRMWTDITRRAQPGYVAAPASLLAFVAWQHGNGALANVALDRALADQPGYSMAELLRLLINTGAPPSLARLPMTPEEVAACYDNPDDDLEDEELPSRHG